MLTLSETNFQSVLALSLPAAHASQSRCEEVLLVPSFFLGFHRFRIELLLSAKHFISCEISCDDQCLCVCSSLLIVSFISHACLE